MLDPRTILEDHDVIKANLQKRTDAPTIMASVDEVVALARRRLELIQEQNTLRNQRNVLSKQIGLLYRDGKRDEAEAAKKEVQEGNVRTKFIEEELLHVETNQREVLHSIPNVVAEEVPPGRTDADNVVVRSWGEPRELDFEPEAHVELGERLGILDFERAAKLSGARFTVLTGLGARLERALINFFLDLHTTEHAYIEVMVPYVVHRRIMEGTGQLPKFETDMFRIADKVNGEDAFLIPTAEVPVTNLHREEILDNSQLPLRYTCFTPCFRAEAGAHGRDARGLIRLHQFHKVELVSFCAPEDAEALHETMLGHAERCLQLLGLPYRVVLLCGGDTGFSAHKCYDIEVWVPSQGKYREISSVSWFGDYQARRMSVRYRPASEGKKKAKARHVHTLNGSGLAVGRTIVAVLENYQQADGSVVIPEVLRPFMGGVELLQPPQESQGS